MKKHLRLFLSTLLLAVCGVASATDTPLWTASEQGYANQQAIDSIVLDDKITAYFSKGSNSNGTKYYNTGAAIRCYGGNTITFKGAGVNITNVTFSFSSGEGTNAITSDVGSFTSPTWTGNEPTVVFTIGGTSGHRRIATIIVSYAAANEAFVPKPQITPATGNYLVPQTVSITAADTLTTYYTLNDGADSEYTAPFEVSESTRILAYSQDADGNKSDSTESVISFPTISYTGNGTVESPLDVTSAVALVNAGFTPTDKVYVKGTVSKVETISSSGSLTYYITQDETTDTLQIYYGLYLHGDKFTNNNKVAEGDEVVVYGNPILYNDSIAEITSGSILYSRNGLTEEEIPLPEYTTIAAAKEAATAEKTSVVLKLNDVLVTYVKNSNTYIADETDGFLLYGSNLGLATGQNVYVEVTGDLYLYNGLPEIAVTKVDSIRVNSENNEITPAAAEVSTILGNPLKYSNTLVTLEGVSIKNEAWVSKNDTIYQDGEELTIRDNWNIAADVTFKNGDTDTYNITGIVAIYNTNVQLYPRSKDDIVYITELILPTSGWTQESDTITSYEQAVSASFNTNSDGAVNYESTDPSVATVDNEGNITIVGPGICEIKATTAETGTYLSSTSSLTLVVKILAGEGTVENPYTYTDATILYGDIADSIKVWITGYIVGYADGSMNKAFFSSEGEGVVTTNILLAATADETDAANCLPVQLPNGAIRSFLNLKDNPVNIGKNVKLYGSIAKYFSVCGIKNVTDAYLEDVSVSISGVAADNAENQTIYTITGVKVKEATAPGIYIINGKKVLVK